MKKYNLDSVSDYEVDTWLHRLGSAPIETVAHADHSASYEMTAAHVLKLENDQYALVTESGCSCYGSEDADIELFPNEAAAMEQFNKWDKENSDRERY